MTKPIDPYERAFSDYVDYADTFGEKIGGWIAHGGWKIITLIVTILAILTFGFLQFFWGFGKGFNKKRKHK